MSRSLSGCLAVPDLGACLARRRNLACVALLWIGIGHHDCFVPTAHAQTKPAPSTPREEGLAALREKRFDTARSTFERELANAGTGDRRAEPLFFLGLADQQAAEGKPPSPERQSLLTRALKHYEDADRARPRTAGILNNLAHVQLQLGQTNDALATYARTLEAADARRPLYAKNYADALLGAGRWRDACRFYAWAAGEQPQDSANLDRLISLCLQRGPDLLGWYLWELADAGHVVTVAREALRSITSERLTPAQREELAALLATCLARQTTERGAFAASETGRAIDALRSHRELGPAMEGLWLLHTTNQFPENPFPWWNRPGPGAPAAARGVPPHAAFQDLARSLAQRERIADHAAAAESLLLVAVRLRPDQPDPEALLAIANLYAGQQRLDDLGRLLQRYRVELFQAKGDAYAASDYERMFRYHMTLGVIYSHLGRWTSPGRIDSAEFQLRNALRAADELESQAGKTPVSLQVPPELVGLLADGYERAGQPDRAAQVRVERAERYLAHRQFPEARTVLQPVLDRAKNRTLPPSISLPQVQRLEDGLRNRSASVTPAPGAEANSAALSVQVQRNALRVAGATGEESLTAEEQVALSQSVRAAFLPAESRASDIRNFSTTGVQGVVQEVTLDGRRGSVLMRRGTNLLYVPFTVQGWTNPAPQRLRVVRP